MGTRSITCIYHAGHFVYAQRGRGDGYPEGFGLIILHWLLVQGNIQRLLSKTVRAERFAQAGVTGQMLQAVFRFDDLPGDEDAFMAACGGVRGEDWYFDWSF